MDTNTTRHDEAITASDLRDFIRSQHRAYIQLQILTVALALVLAAHSIMWGISSESPIVGTVSIISAALLVAAAGSWILLLLRRTALVRMVLEAPAPASEGPVW